MTNAPVWLARSLALPLGGRSVRHGTTLFEGATALLRACGFATAERRIGAHVHALPVPCIVELEGGGELAVVRGVRNGGVELELEKGTMAVSAAAVADRLTGRVLIYYPTPVRSVLRTLLRLISKDRALRGAVLDALGMSVFLRGLSLILPLLSREALVRAIPGAETSSLTAIAIAVTATGGFVGLTSFLRARTMRFVEVHVAERFTRELFVALVSKPFDELRSRPYASYMEDVAAADEWVRQAIPQILTTLDGAFAFAFLAALAWLSPTAAVLAGVGALLAMLAVVLIARGGAGPLAVMLDARTRRQNALVEAVDGIEVVRMEALEERATQSFARSAEDGLHAELRLGATRAATEAVVHGLERGLFLVVFLLLGWRCLDGAMSIADVMAALQLVTAFEAAFRPLLSLPERTIALGVLSRRLAASLGALEEAPAPPRVPGGARTRTEAPRAAPAILVQDVSYRHGPEHPWVLRNFDFRVERGHYVTLTWPSGSGKTTLLRMIAGLCAPTNGSISVDDEPPNASMDAVCYVPQAFALLTLSVMENLQVLARGASPAQILAVARATGLAEMVEAWPMGWRTRITGGGLSLSSGQRQLLLLTAAAASRCPIVLLDEAYAHLDARTKQRFLAARPFEGRTVLSVEHEPHRPWAEPRPSTA